MEKKVWEREGFRSEEFYMAAERIGRTSEDALRWIVTFAQTNGDDLNEAQRLNEKTELGALLDQSFSGTQPAVEVSFTWFRWDEKVGNTTRPSWEQVQELRKVAQKHLSDYVDGRSFEGVLRLALRQTLHSGRHSIWFNTKEAAVLVMGRMMFWILEHEGKIRICPECEGQRIRGLMRTYGGLPAGVFVAARKDQQYCSVRCQNRVKQRTWQGKQAEKARLKATQQAKRKRTRKGENT